MSIIIRWIGLALLALVLLFGLIQLVPYSHNHTNPPVQKEPPWDSLQTQELASRACYDCHSNESTWPWYSNVAPVSWLIQHDVEEGRHALNLSEWGLHEVEADEVPESVHRGDMPPWYYVVLHPQARLSQTEQEALIQGMLATGGGQSEIGEHERDE